MRPSMLRPTLLSLALLLACGHVAATEARHLEGPEAAICPDESSNDASTVRSDQDSTADTNDDAAPAPVRHTQKAKPTPVSTRSSGGTTRTMPSRFHSFLPGMFR